MHNLRRFYYQNKSKIWKIIFIIAFLLGGLFLLNKSAIQKSNKVSATNTNKITYEFADSDKTYISGTSSISGQNISQETAKKVNKTISKFLQYCKNQEIENAYNMLSTDCKEVEFNTIDKFKQKYIKNKFNSNSIYEIENWIKDTYKVSISEDILATGNINPSKQIEYITIVQEAGESKLNINSYIGKQEINKEITKNDIKISVINKEVYLDYEIYNFHIENLSNKTIKIDSLEKTNTMYLEDKNGSKYNSYSHEILEEDLEIKSKRKQELSIKYKNVYSDKKQVRSIVFENIILDYIEYKKAEDNKNFKDICNIKIEI